VKLPRLGGLQSVDALLGGSRRICGSASAWCGSVAPLPQHHVPRAVQAKREGADIEERFVRREAADEAPEGRVDVVKLAELLLALQRGGRGDGAAATLATRFKVPEAAVRAAARYYSVPRVHSALIGREHGMVAEWQ
jgi:hypothetical protein